MQTADEEINRWVEDTSDNKTLMPVPVLGAFLRLGRKYEIDHLRKQALKRLAVDFPTDLDTCTDVMLKIKGVKVRTSSPRSWPTSIDVKLSEGGLLTLINILRDNDLGVFLPFLFAVVVFFDIRRNLSVLQRSPYNGEPILSLDDIDLVVRASRKIAHLPSTGALSWTEPSEQYALCENDRCDEARGKIALHWYKHDVPIFPLFREWSVRWTQNTLLCDPCKVQGRIIYREAQEKIWEMLPNMFALPGWEELRSQQSTVSPLDPRISSWALITYIPVICTELLVSPPVNETPSLANLPFFLAHPTYIYLMVHILIHIYFGVYMISAL